jgi:hypothetical protein
MHRMEKWCQRLIPHNLRAWVWFNVKSACNLRNAYVNTGFFKVKYTSDEENTNIHVFPGRGNARDEVITPSDSHRKITSGTLPDTGLFAVAHGGISR